MEGIDLPSSLSQEETSLNAIRNFSSQNEGDPLLKKRKPQYWWSSLPPWVYAVIFLFVVACVVGVVMLGMSFSSSYRHCVAASKIGLRRPVTECKYYIFVTIPAVIFFYSALFFSLLRLRPFDQPSAPLKRSWRYAVLLSFTYLLIYPALYQFLVIVPNPKLYISAFLIPFALRQSTLFVCGFFLLKSWWRNRAEPGFVRAYWMVLVISYVLQYLTFFWRYNPLEWYNILLFGAAIPHTTLVLSNFLGTPSAEELEEQKRLDLLASLEEKPEKKYRRNGRNRREQSENTTTGGRKRLLNVFKMCALFAKQLRGNVARWSLIALAVAILTGIGYAFFEIEALNAQGGILGDNANSNCSAHNETSSHYYSPSSYSLPSASTTPSPAAKDMTSTMLFYALWLFLQDICLAVSQLAAGILRYHVGRAVRCALVPYLVRNNVRPSHGVYLINQQCYILDESIEEVLQQVFTPLCQMVFAFIFLVQISLPLTGILIAISTGYVLIIMGKIFVIVWLSKRREEMNSSLSNLATDTLHHIEPVESYVAGWEDGLMEYIKIQCWESLLEGIDLISASAVLVAAIWFGETYSDETRAVLTSQQFVSFVLIAETFNTALSECCAAITSFTHSFATIREVAEELRDAKEEAKREKSPSARKPQTVDAFLLNVTNSLVEDGFVPSVELDEARFHQIKHLIEKALSKKEGGEDTDYM